MPPKAAPGFTRGKTGAFKPPRQVNTPAASGTAKKTSTASKRGRPAKNVSKGSSSTRAVPDSLTISSGDEIGSDGEDNAIDHSDVETRAAAAVNMEAPSHDAPRPAIAPKLLARLLHNSFEDSNTKISKEAMAVVGKYMETFVREALARAAFERDEAEGQGSMVDGFLQVEDLEKLAPQLLLDF